MNYATNDCNTNTCHTSCKTCFGPSSIECYSCTAPNFLVVTNMSCVSACPIQTYYNATELKCLNCHSSCAHCTGPGITECTQCMTPGYYVQVNSSLCDNGCAPRSYIDAGNPTHCQPCDATCDTCIGPTDHHCDSCFDLLVLDYDLSCQVSCSPNYFANAARRCVQCTYSCKNCTTNGFYNCTECFDDRFLRNDSACILNCLDGFYYDTQIDRCQTCHASCKNCTGPNPTECTECYLGWKVLPDGTCKNTCPDGTYKDDAAQACSPCFASCATCSKGGESDCSSCKAGLYLLEDGKCDTECEPSKYADKAAQACKPCHASCNQCVGPGRQQCSVCPDPDVYVLANDGRCLNCFEDADLYPDNCKMSVDLKLNEASIAVQDDYSSGSLIVSYPNSAETFERVALLNFKDLVNVTIENNENLQISWRIVPRKLKFILDLNFTKDVKEKVKVVLIPIKKVILKNSLTNTTELIFTNKSTSYFIQAAIPPNPSVISSIKSMASGAETSSSSFSMVTAALCASVTMFPSLVSPLMKLFRIFKMLSRLRLINIYFGSYLEIFLSVCNLLFSLGGDEMTRETLESAPDTRGKLRDYAVTPISVQPLVVKLALFCLITAIRVYRDKIRRYAVKVSVLSWSDWLMNKIAESMRITAIASLGLDILFYSVHSLVHIRWSSPLLSEAAKHSLWLSSFAIGVLTMDSILLLIENRNCHFSLLRQQFRWIRKIEYDETQKKEKKLNLNSRALLNSEQSHHNLQEDVFKGTNAPFDPKGTRMDLNDNQGGRNTETKKIIKNASKKLCFNVENEKKIDTSDKKVFTNYFNKDDRSNPDAENFFGNGILLHKLRTSPHARYFNAVSLLKMLSFEPVLVSLQMLPTAQVFILLLLQLTFVSWLIFCGFKEKIFASKAIFISTLICDVSIFVFLLLGLVFHMGGGVKTWPTNISTPLQFTGVVLLLLSCLFGLVDLAVSTWIIVKTALAKRKVQKFQEELQKSKDQQEESMIKLRDEEGQKSQAVEPSPEPMGLMDRRALSPFWRLKFKKASAPDDQTLKRPDLQLV
jgi:hypothetical protein